MRAHYHCDVWVTLHGKWVGESQTNHLIVCPSMCGPSWHGRKVSQSDPTLTNGFYAYEIVAGRLAGVYPFTKVTDLRVEEPL